MKGKSAIESAERTMSEMEEEVEGIRVGLKKIRETEERNSLAVQQALDVFEELKKDLKEKKTILVQLYRRFKNKLKMLKLNSLNL